MVVVESGRSGLGEWRPETVNFYQDYKTLFGAEPGKVLGIGVMTSASYTKSVAIADYDDFFLLERAPLPPVSSPLPRQELVNIPEVRFK